MRTHTLALLVFLMSVSGCGTAANQPPLDTRHPSASDMRCPVAPSVDRTTASGQTLVPGDPTAVLVCRYLPPPAGIRPPRFALAGELEPSDRTGVARLAAEMNALRPYPRIAVSCPQFGGRTDLLVFRYPDGRTTRVRITRAGCIPVSNGRLLRTGLGLPGPPERHWPDEGLL